MWFIPCFLLNPIKAGIFESNPRNTPRVFHAETTWERPLARRLNVGYQWGVCMEFS